MATWQDGPEYAPVTRPDHFADAAVAPLEAVPPAVGPPPAPAVRPGFTEPTSPTPELASLAPPVPDQRDPAAPFEVVASTVTEATSAWSAAHWSSPAEATAAPWPASTRPGLTAPAAPAPVAPFPVAPGQSWAGYPPPASQPFSPSGPAPAYGEFAASGSVGWFAPAPPPMSPGPPAPLRAADVVQAATPGVLISLVIGGLIYPLAPIAVALAFVLATRIRVARARVRAAFWSVLGLLALVGLIGLLVDDPEFSQWWLLLARWAQVLSWALAVAVVLLVRRGLRPRPGPPAVGGPPPGPWT